MRFDIGGFGVGEASDLTWNLMTAFDYKLKGNKSLIAGYRILDIDYDARSDGVAADIQLSGPVFGLNILY